MPFLLDIFSTQQFCFCLIARSSTQNLLMFFNTVFEAWHMGKDVDVLLDIQKAFDTVSHYKLLNKLRSADITGNCGIGFVLILATGSNVCVLMVDFLICCHFFLECHKSILGPLFFVLYIKLPDWIHLATTSLFANDTKCLKIINNPYDIFSLQQFDNVLL